MLYKRFNDTYMLRIDKGEEIMHFLQAFCEQENITLAQVSAIGAADSAAIGVYDLETGKYHREDLPFFMEIASLSGSVTEMNGKPYIHLHTTLADQQNKTHAGHVIEITIGATCEMFVRLLPGEVTRKKDEAVGLNLWTF